MDVETETSRDWAKDVDIETPSLISDVKISVHVTFPFKFLHRKGSADDSSVKSQELYRSIRHPFISLSVLVKSISLTKQNIRN